jgi:hypothetical protein
LRHPILIGNRRRPATVWSGAHQQVRHDRRESFFSQLIGDGTPPGAQAPIIGDDQHQRRTAALRRMHDVGAGDQQAVMTFTLATSAVILDIV